MSEQWPHRFEQAAPDPTDWVAQLRDLEWQANHVADPGDPGFAESLEALRALQEIYGPENVVVSSAVRDETTGDFGRAPGKLGVFVRKGAEARRL